MKVQVIGSQNQTPFLNCYALVGRSGTDTNREKAIRYKDKGQLIYSTLISIKNDIQRAVRWIRPEVME